MKTVLVLHGYSQNGNVFSKRIGALRKQCAKNVEFVFTDAPIVLQPADLVFQSTRLEELGLRAEVQANEETMSSDPSLTPRAWWKANPERTKAIGLEKSIMYVREVLRMRKFDGVFGFSQGAAFAALLSALLERPEAYPPFLIDGKAPHPPFEFCVAVSGFKVADLLCEPIWADGFSTPTLHVIGKTDIVVIEERSQALLAISKNARLEEHVGGHFVPSKGPWRKFLAAYLSDPAEQHVSPEAVQRDSANASATSSSTVSRSMTPAPGDSDNQSSSLVMKL